MVVNTVNIYCERNAAAKLQVILGSDTTHVVILPFLCGFVSKILVSTTGKSLASSYECVTFHYF